MTNSTFAFTILNESSSNTTSDVPANYDGNMAWLLGACCEATYQQYDAATSNENALATQITTLMNNPTNVTITVSTSSFLTVSEANGPGPVSTIRAIIR